jgi:Cu/Ag efflux protein CusF
MKKVILPTIAAMLFAGASVAFAADATGAIKSIDTAKDTVTLDNGSTYVAPASVKLSNFKVGEKVSVNYSMSKGKMEASSIKPAT